MEEFVSWGDDGFPYPCVIFGNEVHGPADDFHFPVIGEGGYLVQDAADEQGTVITPALSGVNPVDGVGAALDVAFERLPCLFQFFFLRSCGFIFPSGGFKNLLPPIAELLVAVLIASVRILLPVVIESAPSRHHRVGAA